MLHRDRQLQVEELQHQLRFASPEARESLRKHLEFWKRYRSER